jgi:phage gp46-like protein
MPASRSINPATGDYEDNGAGGWETTDDESTTVRHALLDNLNQWTGAADQGSDLYLLERADASNATMTRADAMVRDALAPLVTAGKIRDLEVTTERDQVKRLVFVVSYTAVRSGSHVDLSIKPWGP